MISTGRKVNELLNKYFQTNNKKQFLADLMKWVTIEKSKHSKKIAPKTKAAKKRAKVVEKKRQEKLEVVKKEVLVEVKKYVSANKP